MKGWFAVRVNRYALALLAVSLALVLSELLRNLIPHAAEYLFLLGVAITAWLGGRGPGLLAAVLAPYVLDYFFLPPLHTFGISREAWPFIVPFLLSALAAAWMSSMRNLAHEARSNLLETQERFRRVLMNLPDIAWTMDCNLRLVYVSPKVQDVLGYSSEEIRADVQNLFLGRIHPEDSGRVVNGIQSLFVLRQPHDEVFRIQKRDGSWIWVNSRAVRTHQNNGIAYADGFLSDVTARKGTEIELQSKTALLEAQINSTIDGILVVDPDGRQILQNRRLADIFEFPHEVLRKDDGGTMLRHVLQLVKSPEIFLAKLDHLHSHPEDISRDEIELKNQKILDCYSSPVKDSLGGYYGRIWIFRDITERKQNEDILRQLSKVVEQSPVSVMITDPDGRITYANRKFTESTGYTVDEILGKDPRILNSGYASREVYKSLWDTVLDGREWRGEFRNKKKNGEIYWETAVISPIFDERGKITHLVAVKEDTTQRRAIESELRQAQKLEGIGQLAAGIAHEINTPTQFVTDNLTFFQDSWTAVSQLLALYREANGKYLEGASPVIAAELREAERRLDLDFISEEIPRAISQSLDGARRVANIVRAMKEFSHPDSAEKIDTDLNKAIQSTITVARSEWKYVAEMVTQYDDALPPVFCYPGEVNQVILNVVVNAAHSIKEKVNGNEKGTITICTALRGEFAEIAISDTGMGIPEEIQGRIYEPFFTTKDVGMGTGQGLALAHSVVVKKHQGKIWFETERGRGTTFFIYLPIGYAKVEK